MAKKVTVKPSRGERAKKSEEKQKAKFKMSKALKEAVEDLELAAWKSPRSAKKRWKRASSGR